MVRCAECGKLGEGSMEGWQAFSGLTSMTRTHRPARTCSAAPAPTGSSARLEGPQGLLERTTLLTPRRSQPTPGGQVA
jgi:hypothetical protein